MRSHFSFTYCTWNKDQEKTADVTFPLLPTMLCQAVALIFFFHSTLFFFMQLWSMVVKHEAATAHVTQQVAASSPKSEQFSWCHQPCLDGLWEVAQLKLFIWLYPPQCTVVLEQSSVKLLTLWIYIDHVLIGILLLFSIDNHQLTIAIFLNHWSPRYTCQKKYYFNNRS